VLRQQQRFDETVRLLDEVIGRYEQYPNPIGLWYALNARSADRQALHNVEGARADASQAYELAKRIGFPLYLSDSARRLAAIAADRGEFRRAYELSVEAASMADRATRERANDRMVELAQRYETESRQRQISELTQRTEQQAAELARRASERRWLWTVLGGSALALIVVAWIQARLRRAHRALGAANASLQLSQDELRALNASLEQQVQTRTAEATRLAQTRSDFLAHMSHELRTPLNGILGFSEILLGDRQLTDKQAKGVGIIRQSGQHLLELINELLDLARIDAARLELEPGDVRLAGFLDSVTDIVLVKAEQKKLEFRCEASGELPATIRVDEKRLRQVLLNLLSNAVKFTDAGHVVLRLKMVARDQAPADASDRGAKVRVRFEVEDSGVGMADVEVARIFDAFEQVGERRRRAGGAGLGLAISRQLVELMGSRLQVDSRPGAGSVFWFELELSATRAPVPAAVPSGSIVGYRGPRRRVLVADDVPPNLAVMVDVLAALGFDVSEATNGKECVERTIALRPDLILMDVMMPVMDGLEATRSIRADPSVSGIPIIATSASATSDVEADCRAAGANSFIAKPIDRDAFLDLIARHVTLEWVREPELAARP
jgi:signal transduction histidine kinase/ActR/RegA family two-component response regulator